METYNSTVLLPSATWLSMVSMEYHGPHANNNDWIN